MASFHYSQFRRLPEEPDQVPQSSRKQMSHAGRRLKIRVCKECTVRCGAKDCRNKPCATELSWNGDLI